MQTPIRVEVEGAEITSIDESLDSYPEAAACTFFFLRGGWTRACGTTTEGRVGLDDEGAGPAVDAGFGFTGAAATGTPKEMGR